MEGIRRERLRNHPVASAQTIDEAEDAVTRFYLPHRLEPLEGSPALDMQLNAVCLGPVTVGYLRYGPKVRIAAPELIDFHVDIPLTGQMVSRCGSSEPILATPRRATVFMPGQVTELQWTRGCAQLCLMLDRVSVHQELELLTDRPVNKPLEFLSEMNLTTPPARSWLRALNMLERELERSDGLTQHPLIAARMQSLLIDGLLISQRHNYTEAMAARPRPAAPRAVRQVAAVIQERPQEAWSVADLAKIAAVSVRSLQDGFQRGYGMSPMAHLRMVRMERAHAELSTSSPDELTVGRVAARWGFPHASRFAAAYKQRYGCSPSETLRRTRMSP